jgi:hypothetical protein
MVSRTFYGMVLFPSIKCLQQRFVLLKNLKTSENEWGKGEK